MINRNDWQVFYRQKIKEMGSLIHLPEVLPPRFKGLSQIRGEGTGVAEPKLEKSNPEEFIVQNSISKRLPPKKSSQKIIHAEELGERGKKGRKQGLF